MPIKADNTSPFHDIVSFGDSLSDTGNLHANSGNTFPPPPYNQGRMSNGMLWNEYLASDLGSDLTLESNYAYFGAMTDHRNFNEGALPFPLIGLTQQVDQYLGGLPGGRIHPRTLSTIWIGSNDFLNFLEKGGDFPIPVGVQNTIAEMQRLADAGGRHFLVVNIPDLSKTPAFSGQSDAVKAQISFLCAQYNAVLSQALNEFSQAKRIHVTVVDAFAIINDIIANPISYGIANTAIPAIWGVDPNASLFWDLVHPTTIGHRIVADFAIEALIESYAPPKGVPFKNDPLYSPASVAR
jgi:phospholipase/lecithinase/hemolysin